MLVGDVVVIAPSRQDREPTAERMGRVDAGVPALWARPRTWSRRAVAVDLRYGRPTDHRLYARRDGLPARAARGTQTWPVIPRGRDRRATLKRCFAEVCDALARQLCPGISDVDFLSNLDRVVDLDPEIADGSRPLLLSVARFQSVGRKSTNVDASCFRIYALPCSFAVPRSGRRVFCSHHRLRDPSDESPPQRAQAGASSSHETRARPREGRIPARLNFPHRARDRGWARCG